MAGEGGVGMKCGGEGDMGQGMGVLGQEETEGEAPILCLSAPLLPFLSHGPPPHYITDAWGVI